MCSGFSLLFLPLFSGLPSLVVVVVVRKASCTNNRVFVGCVLKGKDEEFMVGAAI